MQKKLFFLHKKWRGRQVLPIYYLFLEFFLEPEGEEIVADAVLAVGGGEELFFGETFEGGLDGAGAVEGVLFDESR